MFNSSNIYSSWTYSMVGVIPYTRKPTRNKPNMWAKATVWNFWITRQTLLHFNLDRTWISTFLKWDSTQHLQQKQVNTPEGDIIGFQNEYYMIRSNTLYCGILHGGCISFNLFSLLDKGNNIIGVFNVYACPETLLFK